MRDKWHEYKYYGFKRNGKDCSIWFRIDKYDETIFTSAVHKVPLNVFRILKAKKYLRSHHIYI